MEEKDNSKPKKTSFFVIVFAVVIVLAVGVFTALQERGSVDKEDLWNTYTHEVFNFSIDYPKDWHVVESGEDSVSPIITLYKGEHIPEDAEPPFDHFVNATYISILPQGLGTEGLLGQSGETEVDFGVELESGTDFYLADGSVFATFASPLQNLESWNEAGYIVSRVHIEDLETKCERGGTEVDMESCSLPMEEGAEIVRYGAIEETDRQIVTGMLESFKFIDAEKAAVRHDTN